MSIRAMMWAKDQIAGGVAAKAVLLVLADYADEQGACWPSQATIAHDAELTERSVRDQVAKLEAAGLLTRFKARAPGGVNENDRYRLDLLNHRNDLPLDHRNEVPKPPERPSETTGTTFRLTAIEPPLEPPPSPKARASKPVRSRFAPNDWTPSDKAMRDLQADGYSIGQLERELARMRDHEFKNVPTVWDAAFRKWVRKDLPNQPNQGARNVQYLTPSDRRTARESNLERSIQAGMAVVNRG